MAYAAAVSLKDTLEQLDHFSGGLADIHGSESLMHYLYQMAECIQAFDFEETYPGRESLEKEIRDALWRAEDMIESSFLIHFLSLSEDTDESPEDTNTHASNPSEDLEEVMQILLSCIERMNKLVDYLKNGKEECSTSVAASVLPSGQDLPPQCKNKMVGLDSELDEIKYYILRESRQQLGAAVIDGMGGIGKTSLAISFYNDSDVRKNFAIGAWIKISLEHSVRDILLSLLQTTEVFGRGKIKRSSFTSLIENGDDEGLANLVFKIFANLRYLVVVDCLCEINIASWAYIRSLLPDANNGSRIILVNRMKVQTDHEFVFYTHAKRFLDVHQSWNLLREQVFGDQPCPHSLERIGKRIAGNCQGLPLAIITVGLHLAKEEKTVEYWNKVAESGNSIAYASDGGPMFEQLGLSYKQMPQHLRPVFLYIGAFPEKLGVSISELCDLWAAEGFVGRNEYKNFKDLTWKWIVCLSEANLVTTIQTDDGGDICSLHHALWHFCCNQAEKDEFFHVMNEYVNEWEDSPRGGTNLNNNLRRLIIRKNVLFGICKLKHSLSTIRSLLLTGVFHPFPMPVAMDSYKMLRTLNAHSIRFYEFPVEILCLTLLRYLALTLNDGELPTGISKLRNLQFLIVHVHQIVRSFGKAPTYLSMEIWEMQQLIHLDCEGSDLPVPPRSDALLPNLSTLRGVSPHSCSKEVLERVPNLTELVIRINLAPTTDGPPMNPFDHLGLLQQLVWLHCVITNPYFEMSTSAPHVAVIPKSVSISMDCLCVLILSGCGLPWESIDHISQFPSLQVLELRYHAFRGPKWELANKGFERLRTLRLEDLDLVYWTGEQFFPCLTGIRISRCHKLEQVPLGFVHCPNLDTIEVVDSSSAVETWARSMQTQRTQTASRLSLEMSSPRGASTGTN